MAFQQALSGLNSASKAIDATSHNIANSSTVGFKSSAAHFSDVYAASLAGGGATQVGIGTTVTAITQQFTQGSITSTSNPLDLAINGAGFFRMENNGAPSYTRNGQFHLDKEGYLVNDAGLNLTGHPANTSGDIISAKVEPLQLTSDKLKLSAVATGASASLTGIQMSVNLDSRTAGDKAWPATIINPTTGIQALPGEEVSISPATYDYSTALTIYDTLGNPHVQAFYFVKNSAVAGGWDVYGNVDGKFPDSATELPNLTTPMAMVFDSKGQLDTVVANGTTYSAPGTVGATDFWSDIPFAIGVPDYATTGAEQFIMTKFDMIGTTQFGAANATNKLNQDGYTSGNLVGIGIDGDGIILGRYSNGQSFNIGQIVLADFSNPNGLANIGGNQWVRTTASGDPTVSEPGTGKFGVLQSSATEDSNVDLTAELVNLITQQRNYQANAQSIKTQDQVMQTLVNLR